MSYLTMRTRVATARSNRSLRGRLEVALANATSQDEMDDIQASYDSEIDRRIDEAQESRVRRQERD